MAVVNKKNKENSAGKIKTFLCNTFFEMSKNTDLIYIMLICVGLIFFEQWGISRINNSLYRCSAFDITTWICLVSFLIINDYLYSTIHLNCLKHVYTYTSIMILQFVTLSGKKCKWTTKVFDLFIISEITQLINHDDNIYIIPSELKALFYILSITEIDNTVDIKY